MVHGVQAPLVLSAGDVALLPHGGPHRLRDARGSALTPFGERECRRAQTCQPIRFGGHGRPTTLVVCAFRFRAAHHSLSIQRLARSIRLATGDPATSPALSASTQLLIEESASTKPGSTVVVNRLAGILLIHAIRTHLAGSQCAAHGLRAVADPQIGHALALIHGHPEKPWTVQSLGKAFGLRGSLQHARRHLPRGLPNALAHDHSSRTSARSPQRHRRDRCLQWLPQRSSLQSGVQTHRAHNPRRLPTTQQPVRPGAGHRCISGRRSRTAGIESVPRFVQAQQIGSVTSAIPGAGRGRVSRARPTQPVRRRAGSEAEGVVRQEVGQRAGYQQQVVGEQKQAHDHEYRRRGQVDQPPVPAERPYQ